MRCNPCWPSKCIIVLAGPGTKQTNRTMRRGTKRTNRQMRRGTSQTNQTMRRGTKQSNQTMSNRCWPSKCVRCLGHNIQCNPCWPSKCIIVLAGTGTKQTNRTMRRGTKSTNRQMSKGSKQTNRTMRRATKQSNQTMNNRCWPSNCVIWWGTDCGVIPAGQASALSCWQGQEPNKQTER